MKNRYYYQTASKFTLLFFIILAFRCAALGQDESSNAPTEWTRIESEKQEVSVSVPSNFLVNAEGGDFSEKILVIGFYKDVEMNFSISRPDQPKRLVKTMKIAGDSNLAGNSFQINELEGKNFVSKKPKYYSNTFFLASSDFLYRISVTAKLNANKEIIESQAVARFINSIKVNGKQLIVPEQRKPEPKEKTVAASSLKTSLEISEALKKEDASKIKIKYDFDSKEKPEDFENDEKYSRPFVTIRKPRPGYRAAATMERAAGTVTLKVLFRADGTIGDITVLHRPDNGLMSSAAEAARKIKFLPAEVNGKPVDVTQIIQYHFTVY